MFRIIVVWSFVSGAVLVQACATAGSGDANREDRQQGTRVVWPDLPDNFVKGHLATAEDVASGRAEFSVQASQPGTARVIPIPIPQYAICAVDHAEVPGVVVQAESAQGMDIVGFRPLVEPAPHVLLMSECRMLGQQRP